MKRLLLLCFFAFGLTAVSCSVIEPEFDGEGSKVVLTKAQKNILQAENTFGVELFKSLYDGDNIIISPYSISAAFSMLANGAAGKTYDDISGTLGLKGSVQELNGYYRELTRQLTGIDPNVTLSVANSFWMNKNLTFKTPFLCALESGYDSFNKALDFSAPETKQEIDDWIRHSTNGLIDHIDANLTPQTGFILSNAVYYKSVWGEQPSGEAMMPFLGNEDKSAHIPFIIWDNASCYVDKEVSVCSIPYASGAYSLLALMPASGRFEKFIRNLDTEIFDSYAGKTSVGDANGRYCLRYPLFDISTVLKEDNLDSKLVKLGMRDVLSGDMDYSNMLEVPVELTTVHQAKIVVDRMGTEASAVTTIASELSASGLTSSKIVEVDFDRPFVFAIRESSSGAIIFIGAKVR